MHSDATEGNLSSPEVTLCLRVRQKKDRVRLLRLPHTLYLFSLFFHVDFPLLLFFDFFGLTLLLFLFFLFLFEFFFFLLTG